MLGLGCLLQARHEPLHVVKAVVHDVLKGKNTGFYLDMMRARYLANGMKSCWQTFKNAVLSHHPGQYQSSQPLPASTWASLRPVGTETQTPDLILLNVSQIKVVNLNYEYEDTYHFSLCIFLR